MRRDDNNVANGITTLKLVAETAMKAHTEARWIYMYSS